MHRLICTFVVRIWLKQVFSWCGSNSVFCDVCIMRSRIKEIFKELRITYLEEPIVNSNGDLNNVYLVSLKVTSHVLLWKHCYFLLLVYLSHSLKKWKFFIKIFRMLKCDLSDFKWIIKMQWKCIYWAFWTIFGLFTEHLKCQIGQF